MSLAHQRNIVGRSGFAALLLSFAGLASAAFSAEPVSIVSLIAHPENHDGKQVLITGFLALDFEGYAVYLHRDDYEHSIYKNGIWYAGDMVKFKAFDKKYVNIEGTFDAKSNGHLGLWSGSIKDVKRVWEPVRAAKPRASGDLGRAEPVELSGRLHREPKRSPAIDLGPSSRIRYFELRGDLVKDIAEGTPIRVKGLVRSHHYQGSFDGTPQQMPNQWFIWLEVTELEILPEDRRSGADAAEALDETKTNERRKP